ncbi:MAG: PspC domain-containing protein [Acidobacteriota bacterium]|nr:PspC domain-containing protein [Acidobacteriota bacterium]
MTRYYRKHRINRSDTVYRSANDRMFFGVCGGLAKHFGVNSLWIRMGFVLGTIFSSGLAPLLYVICIFIMPREDRVYGCVPPLPEDACRPRRPRFASQREALDELHRKFDSIENKVRGMEDYVTSKEYVLKRKFENL